MRKNNLYRLGIVAAVAAFTSVACDTADNRSGNRNTLPDSAIAANPAASSTPAGQPATPATPATKGKFSRKKATTSVVMTDKMAGGTMPEFPGGQRALDNYVNDHVNYPQDAVDKDVTGVVRVSFVVNESGKITKVKLLNPDQKIGSGLDEEAIRVVNNMPEWKPATLHGKKVKARLELPISFQVES